jgi:hypothetical protein
MVKRLLIWFGLGGIFLLVFYFAPVSHSAPAPIESGHPSWFQTLTPVFSTLMVLGLFWFFARKKFASRENIEGNRFYAGGRYVEALRLFEIDAQNKKTPLAHFNVGVTNLQLWRIGRASASLAIAQKLQPNVKPNENDLGRLIALHVRLLNAIEGRGETQSEPSTLSASDEGVKKLTQAILEIRSGNFDAAQKSLNSDAVKLMGTRLGELGRVLDSFCVFKLKGEVRPISAATLYGETGADGLERAWPELTGFIARAG